MDKRFPGEYGSAKRNGWLPLLGIESTRKVPRGYWTEQRCQEAAGACATLAEFCARYNSAYQQACRNGWLAGYKLPYSPKATTSGDTFYVWEATGVTYLGRKVYKVGITSWRRGLARIQEVAKKAGLEYAVKLFAKVEAGDAYTLESLALSLGADPKLDVPHGRTEFRAYTEDELAKIWAAVVFGAKQK